jgi:hypothetical protein
VSPVKYELGFYITEDNILHSHRRGNLKPYKVLIWKHSEQSVRITSEPKIENEVLTSVRRTLGLNVFSTVAIWKTKKISLIEAVQGSRIEKVERPNEFFQPGSTYCKVV